MIDLTQIFSNTNNTETIEKMAELFNILGDYTRCKIISLLFDSPKKVNELANKLEMSSSAISHSIRTLKQANIIKGKRYGREISYTLVDEHIYEIFAKTKEHVEE